MSFFSIFQIIASVALLALSVVLHELAHGWVAYKLGDPTAKQAGRLTLNPLKHIDPFGTVILPLMMFIAGGFAFGFAKPVPYNPRYFKNIRKGELLVGLSGPFSNLLQACVGAVLFKLLIAASSHLDLKLSTGLSFELVPLIAYLLMWYVHINLVLMFFNLIPLPPLDGSAIIAPFLSDKALEKYYRIQQYSLPILLLVFFVVPYVTNWSPLSVYFQYTARPLFNLLVG